MRLIAGLCNLELAINLFCCIEIFAERSWNMNGHLKRIYLFIFFSVCLGSLLAQPLSDSTSRLPLPSEHGFWGISVRDVSTGVELGSLNSALSFTPASVQKLLTTAAAFSLLGPDFCFKTRFFLSKSGNDTYLVVDGGWDPALGSTLFKGHFPSDLMKALSSFLAVHRVDSLAGMYVLPHPTSTDIIPDGWPWVDLGNYYGAPISKLSYNQNKIDLTFCSEAPGSSVTLISVNPPQSDVEWKHEVTADSKNLGDRVFIYGGPQQLLREAKGGLPPFRKEFTVKGSVAQPQNSALEQLRLGLWAKGIKGLYELGVAPQEMDLDSNSAAFIWKSPPLSALCSYINHYSHNIMAEHMLVAIGQGNYASGLEAVRTWLAQLQNNPSLFYDDGSGLSRSNGISPALLTLYLSRFSQEPWAKDWMAGIPVSGESGTLINFSSPGLKSKFQGKSGTLSQVKAYAGFLKAKSGRTLSVAVFVNRLPTSAPSPKPILLKTLEEIQRQY